MPPNTWKTLEVRFPIFRTVPIVPKINRHRRSRLPADQFSLFINDFFPIFGIGGDIHPEPFALNLSAVDRKNWISKDKTRDDVRSSGYRRKQNVLFHFGKDPVEIFGEQRRTG